MKKYFSLLFMVMATIISCQKFDDSEIWDKLNNHESRIAYLEEVCKNMNTSIVNLQAIVTALETNDYIISASPLVTGDGYTFLFRSGKSVVIYNGKDGQNGSNGTNGVDGVTPVISVKQDTDGIYYWTVNGEWLLVDGEKVKASAIDGKNGDNGSNGTNGITPKFKIEDGYWYVSYDNEVSWEKLGKATGNNGLNGVDGEDGDNLFNRVYIEDGYVCFELNDETTTTIRIPLMKDGTLTITLEKEGTLSNVISSEQARTTTSLILKGKANYDDMRTIQVMTSLQALDLSEIEFMRNESGYGGFILNPYKDTLINKSISEVVLPSFAEITATDFSYCIALRKVTIAGDNNLLYGQDTNGSPYQITLCPLFNELEYSEGVTNVHSDSWGKSWKFNKITYPSTLKYIPTSLTCFAKEIKEETSSGSRRYYYYNYTVPCETLVCKAIVPPGLNLTESYVTWYYDSTNKWYYYSSSMSSGTRYYYYKVNVPSDAVLYVPSESIEAYKVAPIWENFTKILPLESLSE